MLLKIDFLIWFEGFRVADSHKTAEIMIFIGSVNPFRNPGNLNKSSFRFLSAARNFPCILLVGAKSRKPQPVGLPVLIYPCQNWSPMRVTSVNHSDSVTPKRKVLVVTFVSQLLKMSRNIQDTQILRVGEIKFPVSVIPSTELRWFSLQHGSHDNFVDFGQWVAYRVLPKDREKKKQAGDWICTPTEGFAASISAFVISVIYCTYTYKYKFTNLDYRTCFCTNQVLFLYEPLRTICVFV